jgi:hypothetical protein
LGVPADRGGQAIHSAQALTARPVSAPILNVKRKMRRPFSAKGEERGYQRSVVEVSSLRTHQRPGSPTLSF